MQFKTLDGRIINRQLSPLRYPLKDREKCRSEGQYRLRRTIQKLFPGYCIYEDFVLPGHRMSVDFFVPGLGFAFEFDGIQHNKINSFFHKTKQDFKNQQTRDKLKEKWCEINNFTLVRTGNDNITPEELSFLIKGSIK